MRPLLLDYQRPARRFGPGGWVLLAAGAAAVIVTLVDYRGISRQLSSLQAQAEMLDVRPNRKAFDRMLKTDDSRRSGDEMKQIDQVLSQLETPWGSIFQAVESASSKQIALLGLQPDTQQRLLRIIAEARTQDDMLEYVKRLGDSAALSDVHLVNHQIQMQDPNRPLRFTVHATFIIQP
jgi:Tfp pilus assembly protein PilN